MHQIHNRFGDVSTFLDGIGLPLATYWQIIGHPQRSTQVQETENGAVYDSGCHGAICESDIRTHLKVVVQ